MASLFYLALLMDKDALFCGHSRDPCPKKSTPSHPYAFLVGPSCARPGCCMKRGWWGSPGGTIVALAIVQVMDNEVAWRGWIWGMLSQCSEQIRRWEKERGSSSLVSWQLLTQIWCSSHPWLSSLPLPARSLCMLPLCLVYSFSLFALSSHPPFLWHSRLILWVSV